MYFYRHYYIAISASDDAAKAFTLVIILLTLLPLLLFLAVSSIQNKIVLIVSLHANVEADSVDVCFTVCVVHTLFMWTLTLLLPLALM